ncbi:YdeI/OmpD-associated family protein [Pseudarthrobacter sp. fls2-241-R2A-127]|uniref:YdeI/OmpD-associated family protein n=1 Tax=Pseudarthrobacter sp. fls2-241-R2A-127 TaxID=3040303 RepID=UPI002552D966|nr:YdeI/OmpD-associated family protein [Pseudarthrobacter sp. fls2-241-R2A-127]
MADDLEELLVPDAAAWRAWLEENHGTSPGVWLVLHKKGGTVTALDYPAALDEALCFGWIDGQLRRRDGESSFQRMTPRRSRSIWSARNVGHIARLEEAGKMTDAGRAAVAAAKADGRWEAAYGGQADVEVPPDLAAAIAANPAAQEMFDVLTKTNLFALVFRTTTAKQAATRERRIAGFVEMLARGETPYPQKKRPAGRD